MDEIKQMLEKIKQSEEKIKDTENLCKITTLKLNEIKFELQKYITNDTYFLYFDGCSKGNPGLSGAGGVIYKNNVEIFTYATFLGNNKTNNEAEYTALLIGIEEAIKLDIKCLNVFGDSQLVINQMLGKYSVNNLKLKEINEKITEKISFFDKITFTHVLRDKNKRADELSNIALNI